jgi:hypothetical protein
LIADQPGGFTVAVDILYMRLYSDNSAERQHEPELLEAGRETLQHVSFKKNDQRDGYNLAGVVKACLVGSVAEPIAVSLAFRLKKAVATYETYSFDNHNLLKRY